MTHNTREWEKEFDEQFKRKIQLTSRPDGITVTRLKHFIHHQLQKAREEERERCRKIFIEEVDWAEWGMSDKDASERFYEAINHSELDQDNK